MKRKLYDKLSEHTFLWSEYQNVIWKDIKVKKKGFDYNSFHKEIIRNGMTSNIFLTDPKLRFAKYHFETVMWAQMWKRMDELIKLYLRTMSEDSID